MTKEELKKLGKSGIKNSPKATESFLILFYETFGYFGVVCCGFSDFDKLMNTNKTQTFKYVAMEKENKDFIVKDTNSIYTFRLKSENGEYNGRTQRMYGRNMTNEFAKDFLTFGTAEEIEERKKLFKKLPSFDVADVIEPTTEPQSTLELETPKATKKTTKK